jgi:predicted TIM-barrel fold metal-dependent hydrolase
LLGDRTSTHLIDAHVHAARRPTLKDAWTEWAERFGKNVPLAELYNGEGAIIPERLDRYMAGEGVEIAILLCEYSPLATGIQPMEDLLPIVRHNPKRFRMLANLNPHYHHPIPDELERQLAFGATGLKLHPVHGGFTPNDRRLYLAYEICRERGLPVVFHCGTSTFPGATNRYANPEFIEDVVRDFPGLKVVLAHGGRGWWYDAAAFMASMREDVWVEVSGLPPKKLPEYYANHNFERLARKMIFGTDWPGVPGIRRNANAIQELGLDEDTVRMILHENARSVYRLD